MQGKFFRNLRASSAQFILNQVLALGVFYFLATGLSKADFGYLNWCLAILLTAFSVGSFGIDQIIVRKTAAGEPAARMVSIHLIHQLATGLFLYFCIFIFWLAGWINGPVFVVLATGKFLFSFSSPVKQVYAGQERFTRLFVISVISNFVRVLALFGFTLTGNISLVVAAWIFLASDLAELVFTWISGWKLLGQSAFDKTILAGYQALLKESLPQAGTVVFAALMARFDWIFIGLYLSATALASYSFAYKIFEMTLFPMLIIAPLLIPAFTRWQKDAINNDARIKTLLKTEMIISSLTMLVLNLCWLPLSDLLSQGKYSTMNTQTIFILSLAIPVIYLNNFLWTMHFTAGRTALIFRIFALSFLMNVLLNFLLVPMAGNEGAAIAYLAATGIQTFFYAIAIPFKKLFLHSSMIIYPMVALTMLGLSKLFPFNWLVMLLGALVIYAGILFLIRPVKFRELIAGRAA